MHLLQPQHVVLNVSIFNDKMIPRQHRSPFKNILGSLQDLENTSNNPQHNLGKAIESKSDVCHILQT